MNEFAVEAQGLSKRYGSLQAVDNVSFRVRKGTSFGLLGLNGAGKTTTFKMMVSLIRPDQGTALVAGHDVVQAPMQVRAKIGYVAENPAFYTRMTTVETLRYLSRLLDVPVNDQNCRIDEVLELVGLTDKKGVMVGGYSRGMRHRLGLAQALLSQPQVLFLDEPTLGLDPLGARSMRELIQRLRQEKEVTVLMSSHVLPEVEAICDVVGIFDHGCLAAMDSIANLRSTASDSMNIELVLAEPHQQVVQALNNLPGINRLEVKGNKIDIQATRGEDLRPAIIAAAVAAQGKVRSFGIKENSLEDILLRLVQASESGQPPQPLDISRNSLYRRIWRRRRD